MPVRPIDIAEHFDAAAPLMAANWAETGLPGFPFEPNRALYEHAQASGMLVAMGAFSPGDDLVGYATAIVAPHPFNPAVVVASTDTLYVQPDYRAGLLGARLMQAMEAAARERGARYVFWHMRAGTPGADMLARHGYQAMDTVMAKEL
jgi:GNAT superfamily N-acetyltransferase